MKKLIILLLLSTLLIDNAKSQVIPLKEVSVFPDGFAFEVINKMKIESSRNLISKPVASKIRAISTKNDTDTISKISQNVLFKLDKFKYRKYSIDVINGTQWIDDIFFKSYFIGDIEKYATLGGRINGVLTFENLDFLNDFNLYEYSIRLENQNYIIEFKSEKKFQGNLKIDKNTYNILQIEFNNVGPINYNYTPAVGSSLKNIKYYIENVKTIKNIDNATLIFNQNNDGKISFYSLESLINYSKYEITKFEENKENKPVSTRNLTLKHEISIKAN